MNESWVIIALAPETCALQVPGGCLVYISPSGRGSSPDEIVPINATFVPGVEIADAEGGHVHYKLVPIGDKP